MKPTQVLRNTALVLCLLPAAAYAADDARTRAAPPAPPASKEAPVVVAPPTDDKLKLGVAKEPCVYKPVMTDKDMAACGIGKR